MAYDFARQVTVLFGGITYDSALDEFVDLGDTWEWNGTNWAQRDSDYARHGHVMAYDSTRAVTVRFGGTDLGYPFATTETEEWNGTDWAVRNGPTNPRGRTGACMAYDDVRDSIVLFGGANYEDWYYDDPTDLINGTWGLTANSAPSINAQPLSQTTCADSSVILSVSAAGSGSLSYQWRRNGQNLTNGNGISGATTATLTISAVAGGDAGSYDVVVSNDCGSVSSNPATLSVNSAPSINTHPQSQTLCAGATAIFYVSATGSASLSYQWRRNSANLTDGGNVSGATTATLTINPAVSGDAGSYDLVVTNSCGSQTCQPATLTVNTAPAINTQPTDTLVLPGAAANFSAIASGTTPLGYQWQRNGTDLANGGNISGAATATLTINPANVSDEALYDVVVTNPCASVTSNAARLDVCQSGDLTYCNRNRVGRIVLASGGGVQATRHSITATLGETVVGSVAATRHAIRAGFWYAGIQPVFAGDVNCDGVVNTGDIPAFVLALINPAGYTGSYPGCDINRADMNNDTRKDGADIQPFVRALVGP